MRFVTQARRRLSGLYYGWRMMGLVALIRTVGGGVHGFGFTIFFLPIKTELGLSSAATSLAFSLARAEGAIEGPLSGYLIDRYGAKPIIFTAALLCGIGYILLSTIDSYKSFLIIYIAVISLAFMPGFVHAPAVLATHWFTRYRARALTCLSAAMPVGGAIIAPVLAIIIQAWGWRTGAVFAGVLFLFVAAPLTLKIRPSPESMGLRIDGEPAPSAGPAGDTGKEAAAQTEPASTGVSEFTVRRAMRSPVYWLFVVWMTVRSAAYSLVIVHFVPMMVWKGLSPEGAAFLLSGFAFMNLVAHFIIGWIADQTNKARLVNWCMLISFIGIVPLIASDALWGMVVFSTLFTVLDASIPVIWAAVGDFFGRRRFGTIRGTMSFFYMWGSVLGPYLAGVMYDRTASYADVLWLLLGLVAVSGVTTTLLVRPWSRGVGRDD